MTLPPDPIQQQPTYEARWRRSSSSPPVRILFDNGAGGDSPASRTPASSSRSPSFPVPGTTARSWYLGAGGALGDKRARAAPAPTVHAGTRTPRPLTELHRRHRRGRGRPVDRDAALQVGAAPGGHRGLLRDRAARREHDGPRRRRGARRGSARRRRTSTCRRRSARSGPTARRPSCRAAGCAATSASSTRRKSTPLEPVLSLRKRDVDAAAAQALRRRSTIPLYYQGHAYRAGSRIRVTISAPNGDQPIWAFAETRPKGTARVTIAHSASGRRGSLLPVVPGVEVPTGAAAVPGPARRALPRLPADSRTARAEPPRRRGFRYHVGPRDDPRPAG